MIFDDSNNDSFSNILENYDIILPKNEYTCQFNNYYENKEEYDNFVRNKLFEYFLNKLDNNKNVDINEVVSNFEEYINKKSCVIFNEIGIDDIINIDVKNKKRKRNIYEKNLYEVMFFNKRKCQENKIFIDYFSSKTECVSIPSLIKLCKIIERGKKLYLKENENMEHLEYLSCLITELFDDEKNINRLIKYIQEYYVNEEENNYEYELTKEKKDLSYMINIMKCCGYLLFINYEKKLRKKYLNEHSLDIIKKDQKIINYFIIVLRENNNKIETIITSILSRMRTYLQDIEDCYYNMFNYRKIDIKIQSEKYKKIDVNNLERNKTYFNISRNNCLKSKDNKFNLPTDLKLYNDILNSYYMSSRYLDRSIFMNYNESSVKFSLKFGLKKFIFNMNFYQYSILKLIYKVPNVNLNKIIEKTNLEINIIEQVLNDLLKIELIKRTEENIENIQFKINEHFSSEKTNINIMNFSFNTKESEDRLFNKDKVIYCNIIDILKKRYNIDYLDFEEINSILKKKLPFIVTDKDVQESINKGIDINDIGIKNIEGNNKDYYEYIV